MSGSVSSQQVSRLPGTIALIGSGETAHAGRQTFAALFAQLRPPVRVAIVVTPAGFQPTGRAPTRSIPV